MKPFTKVEDQLDAPIGKDALQRGRRSAGAVLVAGEEPDAFDKRVEWRLHAILAVVHTVCYPITMFDLDEFLHHFGRVRERTRRVAACIPEEHVEWTYKPGAFTLGDLVRHIGVTERFIWAETVHNRQCALCHARPRAGRRP